MERQWKERKNREGLETKKEEEMRLREKKKRKREIEVYDRRLLKKCEGEKNEKSFAMELFII